MSAVFTASWNGLCEACGLVINRGDQARYVEDDQLIHAACEDTIDLETGKPKACGRCFTILPRSGICGVC